MPRIGRLHLPGGVYHLMGRGLERRNIFREEVDKKMKERDTNNLTT